MTVADTNRIHERIDCLVETVSDLTGAVKGFEASCKPCRETVARHDEVIFGNGKTGLRQDFATLSEFVRASKQWKRGWLVYVGQVVLTVLGVVLAMHFEILRQLPPGP